VFLFNEETGEISANPSYEGALAIFDLPLDSALADPVKAEQYLSERNIEGDRSSEENGGESSAESGMVFMSGGEIDWESAVPISSTIKEIIVGTDGIISYTYNTDEYGGGTISALFMDCFDDSGEAQAVTVYIMRSEGPDGILD
jgi:hypothetical protein